MSYRRKIRIGSPLPLPLPLRLSSDEWLADIVYSCPTDFGAVYECVESRCKMSGITESHAHSRRPYLTWRNPHPKLFTWKFRPVMWGISVSVANEPPKSDPDNPPLPPAA
jgi:hypothetical protein